MSCHQTSCKVIRAYPTSRAILDGFASSSPTNSFEYRSASYQIEGGATAGGRGPSIWDKHLQEANRDNGDSACDSYRLWEQDVDLLKQYRAQGYRFSVSWSRIIPKGN